ncbi:MAG: Acyl-CoA dehydrogenase [Solirubrobacterales bacterium]|nr:Acyl-CoA dehydrogenase [Solirubrobacterales bacterium]
MTAHLVDQLLSARSPEVKVGLTEQRTAAVDFDGVEVELHRRGDQDGRVLVSALLGGAGSTKDFPVARYRREAKVMQIFEGANQIQRMVIARQLAASQ